MKADLLAPLDAIIQDTDTLLTETDLTDLQRKFVLSMHQSGVNLRDSVITIPDLTWARAAEILSYEGREGLSSIIGYAEVLLDEEDGELALQQRTLVHEVRSNGKRLLDKLSAWFEG